ncbi:hypothetical protein GCM10022286_26370 [Gryllotalpicola daejeonensis]|uniref:histidine kinase n=1 Tax=Gryllotalpicola daejeonensis TaxID=993087 RepID=A0ABP7ZMI4_9MICO
MTSTPIVAAPRRGGVLRRVLAGGWSTGLFIMGAVVDIVGVINVPGAAGPGGDGTLTVTGFGTLLCLVALAAWVTVFWRRQVPLLTVIAGAVLLLVGVSYLLFLVGLLQALLAWRSRTTRLAAIGLAGVGLYVVRELVGPWGGALAYIFTTDAGTASAHPAVWNLVTVLIALVALGLTLVTYLYGRTRVEVDSSRRLAARESRRADELGIELARQRERESVARDIHDTLASGLSVLSLQAGALELTAESAGPAELKARARGLREQAHSALEDLRVLLGGLRSSGPGGGAASSASSASLKSLGALIRHYRENGVVIDSHVLIEDAERATAAFEASVYRIVQESLTNAIKHAPGSRVSLFLEAAATVGARIRVSNPLAPSGLRVPGAGRGTQGIRERVAELDGTAWLGEHAGAFIVDVTLPWSDREPASSRSAG